MYSFQAKIGLIKRRRGENKNHSSVPFRSYPTRNWKFKNKSRKIGKLKYTTEASFQGKIGWKRPRKRKKKIIVPFRSNPTRNRKFKKNSKKIQRVKKYHYGFISSQKKLQKWWERERIKIIVPFRSNPTRNRKFKKISKKIQRVKKYHYGFISSQNMLENAEKEKK